MSERQSLSFGMKDRKGLLITCMLISAIEPAVVLAQSPEDQVREENFLESVQSYSDDVPEMFDRIDLNKASTEELLSIEGMNETFASSIVRYRRRVGFIHSIDEMSRLDGATSALLSVLRNRVEIFEEDNFHADAVSYSSLSPQKTSLYHDAYDEYGIRNFQRFNLTYRNYELSAITDKDPGENNYLDFCSVSAAIREASVFSVIDLGDYKLSMGNGMLFSGTGVVSKAAEPITPLFNRRSYSLKPYRSRAETKYLRGVAFAIPFGNFELTGFVSNKNFAARIDSIGRVTSIDYAGLNLPTPGGASRQRLGERIAGGIFRYDSPSATGGISAVYFSYDHPFSHYYFDKRLAVNMFLRVRSDNALFSGETMVDRAVSFSANAGLDYGEAQFAIGVRDLRSRMILNYGGVLSESFPTAPEQGIYLGATLHPAGIVKLGFYYDRFRIMSISNEPDRNGEEVFADSYVTFSRQKIFDGSGTVLYFRYRYKTKEDFYVPESDFPVAQSTLAGSRQNLRIDFRHSFSRVFSIRTRLEKNFLSSGESGEMFMFDSAWKISGLSIHSRICSYSTASYASAFYVVENDLPGTAQFMLFYGDGIRISLSADIKINNLFRLGLKVSRDAYSHDREISVGSSSGNLPGITTLSIELSCFIR